MHTRHRLVTICILTFLFAATGLSSSTGPALMRVSFIDVGQGDSILVQSNGFDVLVDGGGFPAGPTVIAHLKNMGVDTLEVIVATHADTDHIGGLVDVLEDASITVGLLLHNGYPDDINAFTAMMNAATQRGVPIAVAQYPSQYDWGGVAAHVLNPAPGLSEAEDNDVSVVLLLVQGDIKYLLTGDIGTAVEATVVARGTPVAADVLKVAHHGSKYSSSASFLAAVNPSEAIITVGKNSYGHPTEETLARLAAAGARIWRTDQLGTIVVNSDGQDMAVNEDLPSIDVFLIFLPLVVAQRLEVTPTPTATATPAPTALPTMTPTPTPTQPTGTSNVVISYIFYDGIVPRVESDEYAEIRNNGNASQNLQGWRLNAGSPGQDFAFPSFNLNPGQACRVYTNENHPESCGFNFQSGSALWNNSGDCGHLYNQSGQEVSTYCYS